MQEHSKKIQELSNFLLDYATTLMAVGQPYFTYCKKRDPASPSLLALEWI